MFLIRNVHHGDFVQLKALAQYLNSYNLPADSRALRKLIRQSVFAFKRRPKASSNAKYLFVAEDLKKKRIVGCALLIARHGTQRLPHLSFEMRTERKRSARLKKQFSHSTLQLKKDSRGFTEIGGLVVHPRYRGHLEKLGKQLSYIRFAFMSRYPQAFCQRVLVEYLPKLTQKKGNPFWAAIGQKLTGLTYAQADRLSMHNKEFILSLFPSERIYTCLLPDDAMQYLGIPGPGAERSLRMLQRLGFDFARQIDPFDGGPNYSASLSKISLIQHTQNSIYAKGKVFRNFEKRAKYLVMCTNRRETKAVLSPLIRYRDWVYLPPLVAQSLKLTGGETLTLTPFNR